MGRHEFVGMSMAANNSDLRAQQLLSSYMRAGYTPIDPPVLQPAEPFLDLSGEDIRRRMFLTSDPHGRELCLRPDLTIPVSRAYLQSPSAGTSGVQSRAPDTPPAALSATDPPSTGTSAVQYRDPDAPPAASSATDPPSAGTSVAQYRDPDAPPETP